MTYNPDVYTKAEVDGLVNGKVSTGDMVTAMTLKADVAALGFGLIASKTSVDGNALASTVLDFASGRTLANSHITHIKFIRNTGTFGLGAAKVKNSGVDMIASSVLAVLGATAKPTVIPVITLIAHEVTGSLSVECTVINTTSCSFSVYVYGIFV